MVRPKYDHVRQKIIELLIAHGNELTSETGELTREIALAINEEVKVVGDSLFKLRSRGVVTLNRNKGKTWEAFLNPEWETLLSSGETSTGFEYPAPEEPVTIMEERERELDLGDDEEISMGRAMVRAAAQALSRVEEAERVLDRFTTLAEQNEKLSQHNSELLDTVHRFETALEESSARVLQLEKENEQKFAHIQRLEADLKNRGAPIKERLTPAEKQAMAKMMRELKRRPQ